MGLPLLFWIVVGSIAAFGAVIVGVFVAGEMRRRREDRMFRVLHREVVASIDKEFGQGKETGHG